MLTYFSSPSRHKVLRGVSSELPQWQRCVRAVDDALGFELGRIFVNATFTPQALSVAKDMVASIRQAFLDRLGEVQWMDAATRTAAESKAKIVAEKIG